VVFLSVLVHPINTAAHPTIPPGYRWALMVGGGPPDDLSRCANAGWAPSKQAATAEGDQNGASATKALRIAGLDAAYRGVVELDTDPIPAGADLITTI
jgi:hypothetical protein